MLLDKENFHKEIWTKVGRENNRKPGSFTQNYFNTLPWVIYPEDNINWYIAHWSSRIIQKK